MAKFEIEGEVKQARRFGAPAFFWRCRFYCATQLSVMRAAVASKNLPEIAQAGGEMVETCDQLGLSEVDRSLATATQHREGDQ